MRQIELKPNESEISPADKPENQSRADAVTRRLWPLNSDALCARAQQRTGLKDFGDPPIEPALSTLGSSLENEADLHPLGRFLMRGHLLSILETRLRLAALWREQFGALSPVPRPVFVTGMPRSGSTFLHELLSQDPENRSPRVWEIMFPLPAPAAGAEFRDSRIRKTNFRLWCFRRMVPQADEVYPVRAVTPHECVAIHSFTLMSEEFVTTCRIPTYEKFLRATGLQAAYAWQKRFLQHLQSRGPAKRWILKSPDHLYALEELFSVFPDAIVIQTHRNPLDVLRSSLRLTEALHGLFGRPIPVAEHQERETRLLADTMERSIRFRDLHPELAGRFMDVAYSELISDPLAIVRRIYQHMECPLTAAAAERMQQFVGTRSRYHHRRYPTLADLGLDVAAEVRRFQKYCQRFGVPCRPA